MSAPGESKISQSESDIELRTCIVEHLYYLLESGAAESVNSAKERISEEYESDDKSAFHNVVFNAFQTNIIKILDKIHPPAIADSIYDYFNTNYSGEKMLGVIRHIAECIAVNVIMTKRDDEKEKFMFDDDIVGNVQRVNTQVEQHNIEYIRKFVHPACAEFLDNDLCSFHGSLGNMSALMTTFSYIMLHAPCGYLENTQWKAGDKLFLYGRETIPVWRNGGTFHLAEGTPLTQLTDDTYKIETLTVPNGDVTLVLHGTMVKHTLTNETLSVKQAQQQRTLTNIVVRYTNLYVQSDAKYVVKNTMYYEIMYETLFGNNEQLMYRQLHTVCLLHNTAGAVTYDIGDPHTEGNRLPIVVQRCFRWLYIALLLMKLHIDDYEDNDLPICNTLRSIPIIGLASKQLHRCAIAVSGSREIFRVSLCMDMTNHVVTCCVYYNVTQNAIQCSIYDPNQHWNMVKWCTFMYPDELTHEALQHAIPGVKFRQWVGLTNANTDLSLIHI